MYSSNALGLLLFLSYSISFSYANHLLFSHAPSASPFFPPFPPFSPPFSQWPSRFFLTDPTLTLT